jgi:hypothetical protein
MYSCPATSFRPISEHQHPSFSGKLDTQQATVHSSATMTIDHESNISPLTLFSLLNSLCNPTQRFVFLVRGIPWHRAGRTVWGHVGTFLLRHGDCEGSIAV